MAPAPRAARRGAWRSLAWQALVVALVALALWWLFGQTLQAMRARGIHSGFDFLTSPAGFDIGESAIAYESVDPYWRAFLVGLANTLRVALLGIVLATLAGGLLGIGRFARNALLRALCRGWVEALRNIPLLLQLLMWYLLLTEWLPDPAQPWQAFGHVFLSKGGLHLPRPLWGGGLDLPRLGAMAVEGGWALTPEFLAVLLGLSCYTAAYIAEVVRGGIAAVPRGQVEAALALGLSRVQRLRRVVLPQALRVIVPPLTSQYLNLTKNASLAVAIGYPDLVSVANTAINQTGRAVECIAVVMAVYLTLSLLTAALMGVVNARATAVGR